MEKQWKNQKIITAKRRRKRNDISHLTSRFTIASLRYAGPEKHRAAEFNVRNDKMNSNPYAPPKSQIEVDTIFKRSIWWKFYFYPITIIFLVGSILTLKEDSAGLVDYIMSGSSLVASVGFFGFVYLKRFLFPKFWKVFFIIFLLSRFVIRLVRLLVLAWVVLKRRSRES